MGVLPLRSTWRAENTWGRAEQQPCDIHILAPPRTCGSIALHGRMDFAGGERVKDLEMER